MRIWRPLDAGADTNAPRLIVWHAMGEYIATPKPVSAHGFLASIGLSAHSLIAPTGTNTRCRQDTQGAYHAKKYNCDSLGLEALVPGTHDYASFIEAIKHPYVTPEQYEAILYQTREWLNLYPIERIARHSDLDPGRKVDPGAGFPFFDLLHDLGVHDDGTT